MKKISFLFGLILFLLFHSQKGIAQSCDVTTPTYSFDLTGSPDSVWTSPSVLRNAYCCAASGTDKCIEFWVTLDTASIGVILNIATGALPGGVLTYEYNCAMPTLLGDMMPLSGPGPHRLVFCKPGTNANTYSVTAVPSPAIALFNPSANNICEGSCVNFTDQSTGYITSFNWDFGDGTNSTVQNPTHCYSTSGMYNATLIVSNSAGADTVMQLITVDSNPFATAGTPQTICTGDSLTWSAFASGGAPPYIYNWNDGSTNYPFQDFTSAPIAATSYTLTVTDINGCTANDYTSVAVLPSTSIHGYVNYSGGALASGTNTAVLYKYSSLMSTFDTVLTTLVDASGNFYFPPAQHNMYLVKIFNDTLVHPLLVPTYYGDHYLWDSATVLFHYCIADDTIGITMVEGTAGAGPGMISGQINEGSGFIRTPGDPVPGIDVKLGRNPGGALITSTQTDSNGDYSFNTIPVNTPGEFYTIYVDIPGLERDSTYNIIVTSTETNFPDLNYTVDSSSVFPDQSTVGILAASSKDNTFWLYPNPAKDIISIEYSIATYAHTSLSIHNVLGVKIAQIENKDQSSGIYKRNLNIKNYNLPSGIYLVTLEVQGEKTIQRLVITE